MRTWFVGQDYYSLLLFYIVWLASVKHDLLDMNHYLLLFCLASVCKAWFIRHESLLISTLWGKLLYGQGLLDMNRYLLLHCLASFSHGMVCWTWIITYFYSMGQVSVMAWFVGHESLLTSTLWGQLQYGQGLLDMNHYFYTAWPAVMGWLIGHESVLTSTLLGKLL